MLFLVRSEKEFILHQYQEKDHTIMSRYKQDAYNVILNNLRTQVANWILIYVQEYIDSNQGV